MSSSASDPQRTVAAPETVGTGQSPSPDRSPEPSLLEDVLRRTLLANPPDVGEATDIDALRGVARRHRGRPLEFDPVTVELVEAALGPQLRARAASPAAWRAMSRQIAQTLFEDPILRDRLRSFWGRLCEMSR